MRPILVALALLAAGSATAQDAAVSTGGGEIRDASAFGRDAITPSRIVSSRIEMNRGRVGGPATLPEAELREQAASAIARAGFVCEPVEVAAVGRTRSGRPLIEVDCATGGGLIVADDDPVQAVDCLDLAPDRGQAPGGRRRVVAACVLPANVAAGAAEISRPETDPSTGRTGRAGRP